MSDHLSFFSIPSLIPLLIFFSFFLSFFLRFFLSFFLSLTKRFRYSNIWLLFRCLLVLEFCIKLLFHSHILWTWTTEQEWYKLKIRPLIQIYEHISNDKHICLKLCGHIGIRKKRNKRKKKKYSSQYLLFILFLFWSCPWCNGYRRRKKTRRHEFKS